MTIAAARKLLNDKKGISGKSELSYAMWYKMYYERYPNVGYGGMFIEWAKSEDLYVQSSYGNGAAMRVVPIGYACDSIREIKKEVKASCHYTHNNPEATDCAFAVALAVYLARNGGDSDTIACMAGGIAEAYYKDIPEEIVKGAYRYLDGTIKDVIKEFSLTQWSTPTGN